VFFKCQLSLILIFSSSLISWLPCLNIFFGRLKDKDDFAGIGIFGGLEKMIGNGGINRLLLKEIKTG
jgi:hypothetical protein